MKRTLFAGLLFVTLLFGAGAFFWYFAYEAKEPPPAETPLANLAHPVTIHWQDNDVAHIEATSSSDAASALGYVHGTQRTWSLALWRQTALGRLGEWFGRDLLPFDRHARQLGLHATARDTYDQLPDSTQRLLTAYAEGVNAALRDEAARRHDEFVLLDLSPAPWEPWHALAIERLMAWFATAPPPDTVLAEADRTTAEFFETDAQFRRWLHLYGFDRSIAWATQEDEGPTLFQRHVYGASALPLLHEVVIENEGEPVVSGASLPGTPFFPAGRSEQHTWALLLSSPLELSFAPVDSSTLATAHERIRFHDGDEVLFTTERTPRALPLGEPDSRPLALESLALPDTLSPADSVAVVDSIITRRRSVWQVQWPGFQPVTDATAWQALATDDPAPFELLDGRGLHASAHDDLQVLGTPPVVERFEAGILIGQDDWARAQAQSLRAHRSAAAPPALAALSADDSSTWAAERLSDLRPLLHMVEPSDTRLREALTYLRNWNFIYDQASIGASVFDAWMRAHRAETDSLPQAPNHDLLPVPEDSAALVRQADSLRLDSLQHARLLHHTLEQAVASLTDDFGPDPRRWRWERVNTTPRYFPVWSADSLIDRELRNLPATRYAPIDRPGRGHPSALAGGTSLLDTLPQAPMAWEGWTTADTAPSFTVRRHRFRTDVFLGRHTAPDWRPAPFPLRADDAPAGTTVLRPAQ